MATKGDEPVLLNVSFSAKGARFGAYRDRLGGRWSSKNGFFTPNLNLPTQEGHPDALLQAANVHNAAIANFKVFPFIVSPFCINPCQ